MQKIWNRLLELHLYSTTKKKKYVFSGDDTFAMAIEGSKFFYAGKDIADINIKNLPLHLANELMESFDIVEIYAGYKSLSNKPPLIWKGGIAYAESEYLDTLDYSTVLHCTSYLIAKSKRNNANFMLRSGQTVESALAYIAKKTGLPEPEIDESLRNRRITQDIFFQNDVSAVLQQLASSTDYLSISNDSNEGQSFAAKNVTRTVGTTYTITQEMKVISKRPTLTKDGLKCTILPIAAFNCGDSLKLSNDYIRLDSNGTNGSTVGVIQSNMDANGFYTIWQNDFTLENRGGQFLMNLSCKSRAKFNYGATGGSNVQ